MRAAAGKRCDAFYFAARCLNRVQRRVPVVVSSGDQTLAVIAPPRKVWPAIPVVGESALLTTRDVDQRESRADPPLRRPETADRWDRLVPRRKGPPGRGG